MSLEARPVLIMLGLKQVIAMTGLSRSNIYGLMVKGDFPRQVSLSAKRVAWVEAHVQAWLRARVDNACNNNSDSSRGERLPKIQQDNSRRKRVKRRAKPARVKRK